MSSNPSVLKLDSSLSVACFGAVLRHRDHGSMSHAASHAVSQEHLVILLVIVSYYSILCCLLIFDMYFLCAGLSRQQSRYPMSPDDRQMPSSPSGRGGGEPPSDPPRRGSAMSRTADLRSGEGRRPSFGQVTYAELGERRETLSREAAAELRGYSDRCAIVCGSGGGGAPLRGLSVSGLAGRGQGSLG